MTCQHSKQVVCGEEVCGTCYGEALLTEPISHRQPGPPSPSYACCGRQHLGREDAHHHCKEA